MIYNIEMSVYGIITNDRYIKINKHEVNHENYVSINNLRSCLFDPNDFTEKVTVSDGNNFNDTSGKEIQNALRFIDKMIQIPQK